MEALFKGIPFFEQSGRRPHITSSALQGLRLLCDAFPTEVSSKLILRLRGNESDGRSTAVNKSIWRTAAADNLTFKLDHEKCV